MVIKIEVKDNNIEQALRVLKKNYREMVFLRLSNLKILMKNSEKKKNSSRKYKRVKVK